MSSQKRNVIWNKVRRRLLERGILYRRLCLDIVLTSRHHYERRQWVKHNIRRHRVCSDDPTLILHVLTYVFEFIVDVMNGTEVGCDNHTFRTDLVVINWNLKATWYVNQLLHLVLVFHVSATLA